LKRAIVLSVFLTLSVPTVADEIPFSKFMFLEEGMSIAEVLLRVGPPDHEETVEGRFGGKVQTTWYYIPQIRGRWLTIIHFDRFGRVFHIERDRP
jgi:hypothetical protein